MFLSLILLHQRTFHIPPFPFFVFLFVVSFSVSFSLLSHSHYRLLPMSSSLHHYSHALPCFPPCSSLLTLFTFSINQLYPFPCWSLSLSLSLTFSVSPCPISESVPFPVSHPLFPPLSVYCSLQRT